MVEALMATTHEKRRKLIADIEQKRGSKVVSYFTSDRMGAAGQIGEDAVRTMYDHLLKIGSVEQLDLFLYSTGGATDVPWRIVTMVREFAKTFAVLVPYKAMSAATMIAIGADKIWMGKKGELGPIDPTLNITRGGEGKTVVQDQIAVEDVMAYIQFLKERVGLSEQSALAGPIGALATRIDPWILGQINRAHSHIRNVAHKLLASRPGTEPQKDEQRVTAIVETLAEKTFQHGHAIGRREAHTIGLPVEEPDAELEGLMWDLYADYEELAKTHNPVDPRVLIPSGSDEYTEDIVVAAIESIARADHFKMTLKARLKRQLPPQLALNFNFNLQLPANFNQAMLGPQQQALLQQLVQQVQQQAQPQVQAALQQQLPVIGFEGWTQGGSWREVADWPSGAAPAQVKGKK